jgi:hypothetical protein
MNISISKNAERSRSRLVVVLETFLLLGFWVSASVHSYVPLLAAGVLFCIAALAWRTEEQRRKYRTEWIALLLGALVLAIPAAIQLGG